METTLVPVAKLGAVQSFEGYSFFYLAHQSRSNLAMGQRNSRLKNTLLFSNDTAIALRIFKYLEKEGLS